MKEVYTNLFVGNENDYYQYQAEMNQSWAVVHACKEPFHRNALGYKTQGAPKDSPYYYFLYDKYKHLIMNIVDGVPEQYYSEDMMNEAINYVINALKSNKKVLIHCNQGESRAPSIALLVLRKLGIYSDTFESAETDFKQKYLIYNPTQGIRAYVIHHW